jgi:hypothetical protein
MAKLEAIRCDGDGCGKIIPKEDAVEKLVRYKSAEGPQGEYTQDLCIECGEKDVAGHTLKAWPRMKSEPAQPGLHDAGLTPN